MHSVNMVYTLTPYRFSPSSDIETKECVAYEGIRVHSDVEYETYP